MQEIYQLTHADAMRIIEFVRQALEQDGRGAAVAVADAHGELIAFLRTDGCRLPPITIAMHKAFTAARERAESGEVGRRSREEGWPMSNFGDPRYVAWGGGVPIVYRGQVVGAVGISGLPEADDVTLAREAAQILPQGRQ